MPALILRRRGHHCFSRPARKIIPHVAERLELRTLLATVSGTIFEDLDADGAWSSGEPRWTSSAVRVYYDANGNGSLDPLGAEASVLSDTTNGNYTLTF